MQPQGGVGPLKTNHSKNTTFAFHVGGVACKDNCF